MYCTNCGAKMEEKSKFCSICGTKLENSGYTEHSTKQNTYSQTSNYSSNISNKYHEIMNKPKSKVITVLLSFFLGYFGIHNFYLGYHSKGVMQLLFTTFGLGFIAIPWAIFEGLMIIFNKNAVDAKNIPLYEI